MLLHRKFCCSNARLSSRYYHRAKYFGKGTVQQSRSLNFIYDLDQSPLGVLQYTIQKFYRVNGGSTQLKGVAADINFPEIIDAKEYGEDKEDNALAWDKIPSASYMEVGNIDDINNAVNILNENILLVLLKILNLLH